MSVFLRLSAAAAFLLPSVSRAQTCNSYGIDFANGGSYFQNNESSDAFTALQEFDGCQDDVSNNLFVDPSGDQSQCSDTPLTPDDTPQLINCTDWPKSKLYSGDWSLLVISNNWNGDPIAYERDFSLSVGPQQTTTVSNTVTVTNSFTPIINETVTSTEVDTSTVPSSTVTTTFAETTTITPAASLVFATQGLITLTQTVQTVQVSTTVETVAASCSTTSVARVEDPVAQIVPTILGQLDNVAASVIQDVGTVSDSILDGLIGFTSLSKRDHWPASAKFKRAIIEGRTPDAELKRAFVRERHERLARMPRKRAPDQATTTVTASDVATSTVEETGSIQTQTITSIVVSTTTLTSGVATASGEDGASTVTAPASTRTITTQAPFVLTTTTKTVFST